MYILITLAAITAAPQGTPVEPVVASGRECAVEFVGLRRGGFFWRRWRAPQQPAYQAKPAAKPAQTEKSLFARLGGEPAIKAVIDDFVARAAANPKVNFTRQGTGAEWDPSPQNIARLKKHLVQLVSLVTGGPQKYEGRGMKAAHAGMQITDDEFNALAADLVATLNKFNVPQKEQGELLKIIASTRGDIVEKPAVAE